MKEHGVSREIHSQRDTKTLIPNKEAQRVAQEGRDPRRKTFQKFSSTPRDIPAFQQTSACWDRGLSYSLVLARGYTADLQGFTNDMDTEDDSDIRNAARLAPPSNATLSERTQMSQSPPLPLKVLRYVRTAPSSPFLHHQVIQAPTNSRVDLAKQESLDVQLLSQKMTTATECMSESMQENAKVLLLLTQALEKLTNTALASQASASGESTTYHYRASPCCGNADLCAHTSGNIQRADVKSISGHAPHPPGNLVGHFHCPSYFSFASSFSSSSSSVFPAQPMASQYSASTTSPKGRGEPKLFSTSSSHLDNIHSYVSSGLKLSGSSQNQRDSKGGIGCFHSRRKNNGKKLGGFLFSYPTSFIPYRASFHLLVFFSSSSTSSLSPTLVWMLFSSFIIFPNLSLIHLFNYCPFDHRL